MLNVNTFGVQISGSILAYMEYCDPDRVGKMSTF